MTRTSPWAALALEDLGAQLDVSAAAAHQELDENPGFERALADADMLAEAVHSRLPDASVIARLVADARRGYERAAALCPRLLREIAKSGRDSSWTRKERDACSLRAGAGAPDDVCLLVEGTYPYVAGGVSAWVHDIIKGLPELKFSVFNIGSRAGAYGPPSYALPDNVTRPSPDILQRAGDDTAPRRRAGAPRR